MAKKFVIFFGCIIIIAFSFVMPKLFLQLEDISREKEVFSRPKKEAKKIDVQAEKIYLVRFIHEVYELKDKKVYSANNKSVAVSVPMTEHSENTAITDETKNEIQKLISNNIIKEINYEEFPEYVETSNIFNSDYTVITYSLLNNEEDIGIGMEEKTGKIISIEFPKSILRNDVDKRTQLENYAKYLDLDIIGDWEYENQILKSEKAQLFIVLEERNDMCMLITVPTEVYEEYNAIRNEYEIVEQKNAKKKK